ncbi:hypothetical protein [Gallibacterium sp. AGMB14963]|uniref:hypothetical protein n=1 Tax=Gallibacterium faecale TaxID=3019086 RepID=UPI0022F19304|nr:hypothetical protein [Gallibacterium sp. AGMB14963]MDA3978226.1 hypothetical protein [Gallibacterium sp. AGMB14963]
MNVQNSSIAKSLNSDLAANTLVLDEALIDLHSFEIKNNKLFLSGIGFIKGVDIIDWPDIDYKLIFKSENGIYTKQLAKLHRPELTQAYVSV